MKKIYLQGYYGHNNLGDDYLFYSIMDNISSSKQQYLINVDTENTSFDGKLYQDIVDNYDNIKIKLSYTNGIIGKFKRIISVIKSNVYVIGGGIFPTESVKYLKYLNLVVKIGNLFNTMTCLYGIDIDNIENPKYQKEWKKLANKVSFIQTRNDKTAQKLRSIVKDKNKIISSVDLTHSFCTVEEKNTSKEEFLNKYQLKNDYMIWVPANPFSLEEMKEEKYQRRYELLVSQFRTLIERYKDKQHVFLPYFQNSDIKIINDIVKDLNIDYKIIDENTQIGDKRLLFKYASKAIVMRFHGVQFALFHSTPFVAISYSPKTSNILNELGLKDLYVEYGVRSNCNFKKEFDLSDDDINKLITALDNNVELEKVSKHLKDTATKNKDNLLKLLSK